MPIVAPTGNARNRSIGSCADTISSANTSRVIVTIPARRHRRPTNGRTTMNIADSCEIWTTPSTKESPRSGTAEQRVHLGGIAAVDQGIDARHHREGGHGSHRHVPEEPVAPGRQCDEVDGDADEQRHDLGDAVDEADSAGFEEVDELEQILLETEDGLLEPHGEPDERQRDRGEHHESKHVLGRADVPSSRLLAGARSCHVGACDGSFVAPAGVSHRRDGTRTAMSVEVPCEPVV